MDAVTPVPVPPDDLAVQGLWQDYCQASGTDPAALTAVERFGDSPAMADALLALVLDGTKTATAGLLRDVATSAVPAPGDHWIACDGGGVPRCVLVTREARTGLLDSVDDAFARDEGEGDRTRAWWLDAHRRFWQRQAAREGVPFDEDRDPVVFERFDVVWRAQ